MNFQLPVKNRPARLDSVEAPRKNAFATDAGPIPSARPESPGLSVVDLSKVFRSGFLRRPVRGIDGVSFNVPRGEVFALLGHNGAGKTTTINCILDLVHPDRGEVSILGRDYRDCASRRNVGYLPERPYFFEHLTGRELLQFYAELLDVPRDERDSRITTIVDQVGLAAHIHRPLRKFSKGMLQRIGLGQSLLGDPELLILDEPMSGLDPMGRREVRELLLDLKRRGTTIILSSHIVPDVEMLADSVGVLREGRLVLTRDLAGQGVSSTYEVCLDCSPRNLADLAGDGRALPAWTAASVRAGRRGTAWVEADDVDCLRELLEACHRSAVTVQSVEPRRSDLEDVFLQAHAEGGQE